MRDIVRLKKILPIWRKCSVLVILICKFLITDEIELLFEFYWAFECPLVVKYLIRLSFSFLIHIFKNNILDVSDYYGCCNYPLLIELLLHLVFLSNEVLDFNAFLYQSFLFWSTSFEL